MAYTTIDDPSAYFQAKTYTGNSGVQFVTNDGNSDLQPDWVWIKNRTVGYSHQLYDSSRGTTKALFSDLTQVETTISNGLLTFNTNGFGVNSAAAVNENELVAWQWKANGGTTSTNTDGVISSTVQVNSDAGFSILTYTMGSGNETVGHGLGVAPDIIITKARERGDVNGFWSVYTTLIDGSLDYLKLNTTAAKSNSSLAAPTSTVFTGAGSSTASYRSFVAYCFKSVQGYSKFGKYTGNGNGNGVFVYTGFKPAFVMVKRTDSTSHWFINDTKRDPFNLANKYLIPSNDSAESTYLSAFQTDIVSNGFKLRTSYSETNTSGATYIYMAFAENPFTTSTGVPCTAR